MIEHAASGIVDMRTGEPRDADTPDAPKVTQRFVPGPVSNQGPAPVRADVAAMTYEAAQARVKEMLAGSEESPKHPLHHLEDYPDVEQEWLALHAKLAGGVEATDAQAPTPAEPIELERAQTPSGYTADAATQGAVHALGERFGLGTEANQLTHTLSRLISSGPAPDPEACAATLSQHWPGSSFDLNWEKIDWLERAVQHLATTEPASAKTILRNLAVLETYPEGAMELTRFYDRLHATGDPDELERLLLALATQGAGT